MFDPNVLLKPPARPQAWDAFPMQHSEFSSEAWADAPQVNPRDPGFRQLAVPEKARVHYDDTHFEAATYMDVTQSHPHLVSQDDFIPTDLEAKAPAQDADQAMDPADDDLPQEPGAQEGQALAAQDAAVAEAEPVADEATALENDEAASQELAALQQDSHLDLPQPQSVSEADEAIWQQRLDAAVTEAKAQAYEEGLQAGLAQGQDRALDEALAQAKLQWSEQAHQDQQRAVEQAVQEALNEQIKTLDEQRGERDAQVSALIAHIDESLEQALQNTRTWAEALKRLAIHIAEQLVLSELSVSPAAIQRLIDRCVSELDLPHAGLVTVELAPHDHDLLKAQADISWSGMEMVVNPQLAPGSVKVNCKDTRISDLIHHRLEPIAKQLLVAVDDWQQQSAFKPGALGARAGFQSAKVAPSSSAITPLSVSSRLIDASDHGGDHG